MGVGMGDRGGLCRGGEGRERERVWDQHRLFVCLFMTILLFNIIPCLFFCLFDPFYVFILRHYFSNISYRFYDMLFHHPRSTHNEKDAMAVVGFIGTDAESYCIEYTL